jgi:hypothetical protein
MITSRVRSVSPLFVFAVALGGCPIWTGDGFDPPPPSGECVSDRDCASDEICNAGFCQVGDCQDVGCPEGQVCLVDVDGFASCFDNTSGGAGGVGGAGGSGGAGGDGGAPPAPIYCGNPDDCAAGETCAADGTCQLGSCLAVPCIYGFTCNEAGECIPVDADACGADADCAAPDKCIDGLCTPPEDQCFDQTQCVGGSVCVDGKCTPSCAGGSSCDTFFSCTPAVELCTTPNLTCTITNDCASPDLVCVDGACVERSVSGSCPNGYVWVENGCIATQSALFVCSVDGAQDTCAAGSICVNNSCYISCAEPTPDACTGLPQFDVCKVVDTTSGSYSICGSTENLGNQCNPTAELFCSPGFLCIDGFCQQ